MQERGDLRDGRQQEGLVVAGDLKVVDEPDVCVVLVPEQEVDVGVQEREQEVRELLRGMVSDGFAPILVAREGRLPLGEAQPLLRIRVEDAVLLRMVHHGDLRHGE